MNSTEKSETNLISYCGFYCGSCPKFLKKECMGCKGETPDCAIGYKACKVRPCCITMKYYSCADCTKFDSVRDCGIYNPFLIRIGQFVTGTNRRKGIEFIKEFGECNFTEFMIEKSWVTFKNK
jgi:hypothetical protein